MGWNNQMISNVVIKGIAVETSIENLRGVLTFKQPGKASAAVLFGDPRRKRQKRMEE